jgi:DNA-binding CsgD family transcriptional regulator
MMSMHNGKILFQLADAIYEAAVNPQQWPTAIAQVIEFVGASAGWLLAVDRHTKKVTILHEYGGQRQFWKRYVDDYSQIDPTGSAISALGQGELTFDSLHTPFAQLAWLRFNLEWMAPQGWIDRAFVVLHRTPLEVFAFGISRSAAEGWVDGRTCDRLKVVTQFLAHSILIGGTVDRLGAFAGTSYDALDGIDTGILLIDSAGHVIYANARGRAMLASSVPWSVAELGDDSSLDDILRRLQGKRAYSHAHDLLLPMQCGDDRYVAHILPLTAEAGLMECGNGQPTAALFIKRASLEVGRLHEFIGQHFSLTHAELRVLLAVVQTGGVPAASRLLGIAETTIKTHLHRVFAKTGTRSQLQLARLVAGYSGTILR